MWVLGGSHLQSATQRLTESASADALDGRAVTG